MGDYHAIPGAETMTNRIQSGLLSNFVFLTDNTSEERREARAHVARKAHRRKKGPDVNPRESHRRVYFTWRIKQRPPPASKCLEYPSAARAEVEENDPKHTRSNVVSVSTSPVQMLGEGSSDPFAAAALPINATVNELMRYSRKWYVDWRWPAEGSTHEQSSAVVIWKDDMKNAIGNGTNFHAALALAFQYMSQLYRDSPASPRLIRSGVRHKISSIESLHRHLQNNGSSFDVLPAIMDLGGVEFYAGNHQEMMLHIEAAKRIVDAVGGLTKINESVRNLIGIADSVISWRLFRRPVFPVEDWDPGRWCKQTLSRQHRFDTAIPGQHASATLGGAHHLEIPNVFLRGILIELNEMLLLQKLAFSLDHCQLRSGMFRWLHLRRAAIKVHLVHHCLDTVDTAKSPALCLGDIKGSLAAAVCIAAAYCHGLIIYHIATLESHFPFQILQSSLHTVLRRAEASGSISHQNLLLWLYFVGALAEELYKHHLHDSEKRIFAMKFLANAIKLNLTSWQLARNVLRHFLYDDALDRHLAALFLNLDCFSTA